MREVIRVNLLLRHIRDTVVILEDENLIYDRPLHPSMGKFCGTSTLRKDSRYIYGYPDMWGGGLH